jgi:hypothetical protein
MTQKRLQAIAQLKTCLKIAMLVDLIRDGKKHLPTIFWHCCAGQPLKKNRSILKLCSRVNGRIVSLG